jgi:hypothetical protein
MPFRACLAILIPAVLVASLIPSRVVCRSLPLRDDPLNLVEPNPQQTTTTKPGGDPVVEPAAPKQTPAPTDPHTEQIKRAVQGIGLASKITVILKNKHDLHGATTAIDNQAFQVAEVDLHRIVTIDYRDVAKVRSGYGGINVFTRRHTTRFPHWVDPIIVIAVVGLIMLPVLLMRD